MNELKALIRKVLAALMYYGWYRWYRSWDVARDGTPLKSGITAVVSARNEEYILPFCLKSLLGIADQVVLIDNGSDDDTLKEMKAFQDAHGHEIEVDILEMPGALLGDCRNAGLDAMRYKWHLRWDADMVCRTSGPNNMMQIRELIKNDRPRTVQLPRTNLRGDFHHTRHKLARDPGEPILMRFGRDIKYVEYGKFDVIRVPFYYAIENDERWFYFHCEGLKSDENMIYRRQYFEWRENFNNYSDENRPERVQKFEYFKEDWGKKIFGTSNQLALRWRFNRYDCSKLRPVDKQVFGDYPEVMIAEMESDDPQYKIVRKDDQPYFRIDRSDSELRYYEPSEEDCKWEKEFFS
jgi:glycosyltransferase involved in cell wall biosynthesis